MNEGRLELVDKKRMDFNKNLRSYLYILYGLTMVMHNFRLTTGITTKFKYSIRRIR
jgi:hypothetical protein